MKKIILVLVLVLAFNLSNAQEANPDDKFRVGISFNNDIEVIDGDLILIVPGVGFGIRIPIVNRALALRVEESVNLRMIAYNGNDVDYKEIYSSTTTVLLAMGDEFSSFEVGGSYNNDTEFSIDAGLTFQLGKNGFLSFRYRHGISMDKSYNINYNTFGLRIGAWLN